MATSGADMIEPDPWDWGQYVGGDYETDGERQEYALQPWRFAQGKAWVTSLAWVWREAGQTCTDGGTMPLKITTARMIEFVMDTKRVLVGWNLVFDLAVMMALGFEKEAHRLPVLDGMLVWRHLSIEPEYEMSAPSKKSYSLKTAVREFIPGHAGYEEGIVYHNPTPEELIKLHDYNIKDNVFALKLAAMFYRKLKPAQRRAMWIEQASLSMVAEANLKGMRIDTFQGHDLAGKMDKVAAKNLAILAPHGVSETVVRSPTKLAKLMFDDWQLPVLKVNKGKIDKKTGVKKPDTRSTDKAVLHELAFEDPRAKQLREFREALNLKTKFALAPVKAALYNGDGCAHPQARVFGTYTSRMTYSSKQGKGKHGIYPIGWAIHQMKNDAAFRDQMIAPMGYTIVEWDAAGQEFKWMAIASGDHTMLGLCQPGEDPHSFMTSRIYHEDYKTLQRLVEAEDKPSKAKRKMGKVGNLSLQYRTSAKKFRVVARVDYDIPMTVEESILIHRTYPKTYPGVPIYWARQIAITRQRGYAETFAGRRVKVVGDWDGSWGWSMGSTSINYRIQGTGGDQKYLAMMHLKDFLPKYDGRFLLDMHDGLYALVPDRYAEKVARAGKRILDNLPYGAAWNFIPPVPLNFDTKMGKSWGSLHQLAA